MSNPMTSHTYFLSEAVRLAEESVALGGGPFGAVVVKDGLIVGRGSNRVTTSNDPTAHGEVVAIRDACAHLNHFELDGCVLYTNAEPCPMCFAACYWARLAEVYYALPHPEAAAIGFDDSFIYKELALPSGSRRIPFHRIDLPGAGKAFRLWVEKIDKIEY
jgi:tRNA(Arg) A34 adenosine deaminase TadA